MRKFFCIFALILISCLLPAAVGSAAAESGTPRVILYTCYRQMGWGDRVQIGSIDEKGVVRIVSGNDSELHWPYKPEEQLQYLSQTEIFSEKGSLTHDELFSIKSLIYSAEDRGSRSAPAANDAGTERSYAVRYSDKGEPTFILLGMSGDDMFENSDPNAQALYLILRQLFPDVTSYAFDTLGMGPQGFKPVPVPEFLGLDAEALLNADIRAGLSDCEEGYLPLELSAADRTALLDLIRYGTVTGKADCIASTGGSVIYDFLDADGNVLETVIIEDGLLTAPDGRYFYSVPE